MAPSRIATSVFTARPGEDGIWTVNMVVSVLPTLSASSRFRNAPSSVCADFTDRSGSPSSRASNASGSTSNDAPLLRRMHQGDAFFRVFIPVRRHRELPYCNIHNCLPVKNSVTLDALTQQIAGIDSVTTTYSRFIGGGTGSVARWLLSMRFNPLHQAIPMGTLAANLIGAFIIGMGLAV